MHTNGYSLARKVFFEKMKLKPRSRVPELDCRVGEELLKVHVSYGPLVQVLLKSFNKPGRSRAIKGLAHITGGGLSDNLPRVLPEGTAAEIERGSWTPPPIFKFLQHHGAVTLPNSVCDVVRSMSTETIRFAGTGSGKMVTLPCSERP